MLEFNQYQKFDKAQFSIYVDLEYLMTSFFFFLEIFIAIVHSIKDLQKCFTQPFNKQTAEII